MQSAGRRTVTDLALQSGAVRAQDVPTRAKVLARFARDVERDIGITVSVGLSCNKFLAKIASDLDKPRGFAALDQDEARAILRARRHVAPADPDVARMLVFLIVPPEAQHRHRERVQEEAPHHAERIRFTQHVQIALARDDRQHPDYRYHSVHVAMEYERMLQLKPLWAAALALVPTHRRA